LKLILKLINREIAIRFLLSTCFHHTSVQLAHSVAGLAAKGEDSAEDSAEEVSDIEEVTQDVGSTSVDQPMVSDVVESSMDQTRQSPALSNMPAQTGQLVETKDVARLKQTVADLERRLKSRYCCRQDYGS